MTFRDVDFSVTWSHLLYSFLDSRQTFSVSLHSDSSSVSSKDGTCSRGALAVLFSASDVPPRERGDVFSPSNFIW